jgi:murein DD-endopeptidase MepM/ murein hydrolase activator NlpD
VERLPGRLELSVDLLVENRGAQPLEVSRVDLVVRDPAGAIVLRQTADGGAVRNEPIPPGERALLYSPLHTLPEGLAVATLDYRVELEDAAGATVALTARARPDLAPAAVIGLPLPGRSLLWEGHDASAHHRRLDWAHLPIALDDNPTRYAFDFSTVDPQGALFRGDGRRNEDWYAWDQPVLAVSDGKVVAAAGNQPDGEVGGPPWRPPAPPFDPAVLWGNYVLVDHGSGVFSLVCHLRQGSVKVKAGDRVRRGETVGRVGFSGSAITLHVHLQLQDGPGLASAGLPAAFDGFDRIRGPRREPGRGAIEPGEIVEARPRR